MLSGIARASGPARVDAHRYFGRGDVLKNAALQFDRGALVEIDAIATV